MPADPSADAAVAVVAVAAAKAGRPALPAAAAAQALSRVRAGMGRGASRLRSRCGPIDLTDPIDPTDPRALSAARAGSFGRSRSAVERSATVAAIDRRAASAGSPAPDAANGAKGDRVAVGPRAKEKRRPARAPSPEDAGSGAKGDRAAADPHAKEAKGQAVPGRSRPDAASDAKEGPAAVDPRVRVAMPVPVPMRADAGTVVSRAPVDPRARAWMAPRRRAANHAAMRADAGTGASRAGTARLAAKVRRAEPRDVEMPADAGIVVSRGPDAVPQRGGLRAGSKAGRRIGRCASLLPPSIEHRDPR